MGVIQIHKGSTHVETPVERDWRSSSHVAETEEGTEGGTSNAYPELIKG